MTDQPGTFEARIVELTPQPTIAVRIQRPMSELDLSELFDTHLPNIADHIANTGGTPAGAPFGRYHQFGPDQVDVEIGIPLAMPPSNLRPLAECESGEMGSSELPGGDSRLVDLDLDQRPTPTGFDPLALMADAEFRSAFQPRVTATSLALTWVAMGRRAAYVTDAPLAGNVHFAAGVTVCLAAGCALSDLRGQPILPGSAATGLIAAADRATHARLLAMVRRMVGPPPA